MTAIDWGAITAEATGYLQEVLRIDTSNPPGNEAPAVAWLAGILRREGLEPTIVEAAPGRANLVCRLRGAGSAGPLLLSSHLDVVPAEAAHWTHPPFSGAMADGCVWGRGALDMKSMTIYGLMALLLAKRHGWRLRRDLILVATADEEVGCVHGAAHLVTHHPELIRAEYALNEAGGFTVHLGRSRIYPIELAHRGVIWVRVRAHGTPGHGSKPHHDLVAAALGRALTRLASGALPFHLTPIARAFLRVVARAMPWPQSWLVRGLAHPTIGRWCADALPVTHATAYLLATVRNTACPTAVRSGDPGSVNVIPSAGELWVDGRLVPGQTEDTFLGELRALLGPGYDYDVVQYFAPTEQPRDTPLYATIARTIEARDPGAVVTPFLLSGFDESYFYNKVGIVTYGFQPMRLPAGFDYAALPHAHDERIPLDAFHWGVQTFAHVVQEFAAA